MSGIDPKNLAKLLGGNALGVYVGYAAFVTTGTTVSVPCPFRRLKSFVAFPVGSPNANEPLSLNETVNADNTVAVTSARTVSVKRAAGTTSGLGFFYLAIGADNRGG
jgi:hypothetical protein